MLNRFVNISRCLTQTNRPLQPWLRASCAASRPPSWATRSMPFGSQTAQVDQSLTELNITKCSKASSTSSAEIESSTKPPTLPQRPCKQRARQAPGNKAGLLGLEGTQLRRGRSRSRSTGYRSVKLSFRDVCRPVYSRSRTKLAVGTPSPWMKNHSLSKYLGRHRLVSLSSWRTVSRPSAEGLNKSDSKQNIAKIDSQWYSALMNLQNGQPLKIWNSSEIERFVEICGGSNGDRNLLHRFWVYLPVRYRLQRWQDLILWCMQNRPKSALALLTLTIKSRYFRPPRYMVQDCLTLLARHFLLNTSNADASALNVLWRLMFDFMEHAPSIKSQTWSVPQDAVQLLLKHCNNVRALSLYEMLASKKAHLTANTILHFLEIFVETGKLELCMELLERIANDSPKIFQTGQQVQSACVKLLRTRWNVEEPYRIQSKLLSRILELGIKPNVPFYNAILLTMIEGRDFDTAWRTYDIANQNGHFWNDQVTYSILAKGAKLSGNLALLEKVVRETEESPALMNGRLICDVLSAISELSSADAFPSMLNYYKRHLDVRPLQELGLCALDAEVPPGPEIPAIDGKWPSQFIVGQMILAYNKFHDSTNELIQRYNIYHDFVEQGHPLLAPLAYNDYVANSFLLAFGKKPETLHYCTLVIKHMLSPPKSTYSKPHTAPTVQTWNILAAAFMKHGQKLAAEKVLTMMRERGLRPDIVTWNTLISGYSALHDVGGAVGAMRRMEGAGFEPDSWTLKGLGRLGDRERLLELLKARLGKSPEQQMLSHEDRKQAVDPAEVEEMAEGWEADGIYDKKEEIQKYFLDYCKIIGAD